MPYPAPAFSRVCLVWADPDQPTLVRLSKKETIPHPRNLGPYCRLRRENRNLHAFYPHSTPLSIQTPPRNLGPRRHRLALSTGTVAPTAPRATTASLTTSETSMDPRGGLDHPLGFVQP
jgi:hypothetical protein